MKYKIESVKRELKWAYEGIQRECRWALGTNCGKAARLSRMSTEICEAIELVDRKDFRGAKRLLVDLDSVYVDRGLIRKINELIEEDEYPRDRVQYQYESKGPQAGGCDAGTEFLGAILSGIVAVGLTEGIKAIFSADTDISKKK